MPPSPGVPTGVFAGAATLDLLQHVEVDAGPDAKATATWQGLAGGGPALNAAVTFAALGGSAWLLTRLGRGSLASLVRDDLLERGVGAADLTGATGDAEYAIPVSSLVVETSTGNRRIVSTDAGAAVPLEGDLPEDVALVLGTADVVLVDGHHADVGLAALRHAARHVPRAPRILDGGRWRPAMEQIVPACTDLVCGARFRLDGSHTGEDLLERAVAAGASLAAVTDGSAPVRWRTAGEAGEVTPPRVSGETLDTAGAGDVFHGAYAYACAAAPDAGPARRLEFAAAVASFMCGRAGTRSWIADLSSARLPDLGDAG